MVAELQTTDVAATDWQSAGSPETSGMPTLALRLLAKVPRLGDSSPSAEPPSFGHQMPEPPEPGAMPDREPATGLAEENPAEGESQGNTVPGLAASRVISCAAPASTDLAARLYEFHVAIKPYAGAIVTLALLASAGLLYWLIAGPAENFHDMQQQYGQDRLGQHSREFDTNLSIAPAWSASGTRQGMTKDSLHKPKSVTEVTVANNTVMESSLSTAQALTAKIASTDIPSVKYGPSLSIASARQAASAEKVSASGLPTPEVKLADTGIETSEVGTLQAKSGSAVMMDARSPVLGKPVSQPKSSAELQPYPKTGYGPFDFAREDVDGKNASQPPRVARRPETRLPR